MSGLCNNHLGHADFGECVRCEVERLRDAAIQVIEVHRWERDQDLTTTRAVAALSEALEEKP